MGIGALFRIYHVESVPFTGRSHFVVRDDWAIRVAAESYFVRFKKKHASVILPTNHKVTIRVNRILSKIISVIYPRLATRTQKPLGCAAQFDWEAIVLKDKGIARSWDGAGKIVVYTGLLDHFDTDEKIATILAHEVGHAIARHSSEVIVKFAKLKWFPTFLLTSFFRKQELEADFIGMILLAASGVDPQVAPRVLEKLGKIGRKYISKNILKRVSFLTLSTHPSPKERSRFLLRPKVMKKVTELYTQVTSMGQGSNKA